MPLQRFLQKGLRKRGRIKSVELSRRIEAGNQHRQQDLLSKDMHLKFDSVQWFEIKKSLNPITSSLRDYQSARSIAHDLAVMIMMIDT